MSVSGRAVVLDHIQLCKFRDCYFEWGLICEYDMFDWSIDVIINGTYFFPTLTPESERNLICMFNREKIANWEAETSNCLALFLNKWHLTIYHNCWAVSANKHIDSADAQLLLPIIVPILIVHWVAISRHHQETDVYHEHKCYWPLWEM